MNETEEKQEIKQEEGVKQETEVKQESTENEPTALDSAPLTLLLLLETVQLCLKDAFGVPESTVEENKAIDRKCYFALRPKKLIEKRIKKLSNG